ncbi:MAG: PDZ domain-containing protein [Bacteroidota bacterium]
MRLNGIFFSIILLAAMASAQHPTINYTLSMSQPWTHLFEVEVAFSGLAASESSMELSLPAWRTGRYIILDFAGGVQDFSAVDGTGKPLTWEKTDKDSWRVVKNASTAITVRYKVYANEFHLRTRGLNDEGAFVDGASVFLYSQPHRQVPLTLTVVPYKNWHVTTGLDPVSGKPHTFASPSYDYLADCPLFIGEQKDHEFEAEGKTHVFSVLGDGPYDSDAIIKDLKRFVKINKDFWGSLPYERYIFMLHLWSQGGGGTEHINSTIMGGRPFMFSNPGSYRGFLGLVSHEYFHTWNVKQIRPAGISPYEWSRENYTKELWVAEGTTSYYGHLLMIRGGFLPAKGLIDGLPGQIENDRRKPGNKVQSVAESSFDAWVKYWRGNQNSYNAESDYYDKGSDVSLLLDLEIRQRSKNKHSLDDVMRALYRRFPWNGTGYTVEDLRKLCEEFGGGSFEPLFQDYVYGTGTLDWERALSYAGIEVKAEKKTSVWLGTVARDQDQRAVIRTVVDGSPAAKAGLDMNDELVALDGYRVRSSDLSTRIAGKRAGEKVVVTFIRNDKLREITVTLENDPLPSYSVAKVKDPSSLQKQIYESWLGTKWDN